jgi:hypothetical protein
MEFGSGVSTNDRGTAVFLEDGNLWVNIEDLNNTIQALIAARDWCLKNAAPSFTKSSSGPGLTLYEIFTKSSATSDPNPST